MRTPLSTWTARSTSPDSVGLSISSASMRAALPLAMSPSAVRCRYDRTVSSRMPLRAARQCNSSTHAGACGKRSATANPHRTSSA